MGSHDTESEGSCSKELERLLASVFQAAERHAHGSHASRAPRQKSSVALYCYQVLAGGSSSNDYEFDCFVEDNASCKNLRLNLEEAAHLLERVSAFDLHATAALQLMEEAADNTMPIIHRILWMVIECLALDKAPQGQLTIRLKRWQSLIFETIRSLQISLLASLPVSQLKPYQIAEFMSLWVNVMLPRARFLQKKLSNLANNSAFYAGALSTSALLARIVTAGECIDDDAVDTHLQALEEVSSFDSVWTYTLEESDDENHLMYWTRMDQSEKLAGMRTSIDQVGLALLASRAWKRYTKNNLPSEWLIRVWFPYIATLLLVDLAGANFDGENDISVHSQFTVNRYHESGLRFLKWVLTGIPKETLHCYQHELSDSSERHPVVGMMQLLANRVMTAASAGKDGPYCFTLMKQLMSKYDGTSQVAIVRHMLRICPHTCLCPKILDLLRNVAHWDNRSGIHVLWAFLDSFITRLEADVIESNANLESSCSLKALLQTVELYDSALNIIYLIITVHGDSPEIDDLTRRLTHARSTLQCILRECAKSTSSIEQIFKLNLLDLSMEKVVTQLKFNEYMSQDAIYCISIKDDKQD